MRRRLVNLGCGIRKIGVALVLSGLSAKSRSDMPQTLEVKERKKWRRPLLLKHRNATIHGNSSRKSKMTDYIKRVVDAELAEQLEASGAVLVVGPKWCGKTTSAMQQARSVIKLQDVKLRSAYLQMADTDPARLLDGATPRLIDEWQEAPILWDTVRNAVDERGEDGQFILTGSTVVEDADGEIRHTGTGRIVRVAMYPMSLYESGESNGAVSLARLFDEPGCDAGGAKSELDLERLVFAACRGGWPSSLAKKSDGAKLRVARNYLDAICSSDASRVDGVLRDEARVRAVMHA